MPNTLQDYLVTATHKAASDLAAAFLRLPEDKRGWSPDGKGRTVLDSWPSARSSTGTSRN